MSQYPCMYCGGRGTEEPDRTNAWLAATAERDSLRTQLDSLCARMIAERQDMAGQLAAIAGERDEALTARDRAFISEERALDSTEEFCRRLTLVHIRRDDLDGMKSALALATARAESAERERDEARTALSGAEGELLGLRVSEGFFRNRAEVIEQAAIGTISQRQAESLQGCCPLCGLGDHDVCADHLRLERLRTDDAIAARAAARVERDALIDALGVSEDVRCGRDPVEAAKEIHDQLRDYQDQDGQDFALQFAELTQAKLKVEEMTVERIAALADERADAIGGNELSEAAAAAALYQLAAAIRAGAHKEG